MNPPRVLLVDDDVALLRALPEAIGLRLAEVAVDTCDNATEALARIAATDFDAIISDIKMPGMDGLALLAEIRALRPDTPALLITGHGEHDLAVQALRGGAYDFIQKPIDREYFIASLTRALQLRYLRRRLAELDRLKTQFFSNVSHELRTPLALVLGPAQKLLTAEGLTDDQRRHVETIERNAQTLLKHVTDLLDLAKLEAGRMGLSRTEVDLARLVRLTCAHFELFARERGIAFAIETPFRLVAWADSDKLERVFLNLLSNAFKFAPEGGRIRCELSAEGDRAAVVVQDNGPGVPLELREAIFERFQTGEGRADRRPGGTGLGLAIAKEFVALHEGTITVEDAPEGGALFRVGLPLLAPPPADAAAIPSDPSQELDIARQTLEDLRQSYRQGPREGREAAGPTPPPEARPAGAPPDLLPPLVLVVEDHEEMNRFIAETLGPTYRVICAFDGEEGMAKALTFRPDLIITDVVMPRVDGERLVRDLRARRELDGTPLIVLTAKLDEELRVSLLRSGAQDYLAKPFSAQELRARAGNLISMKRAREVLQRELDSQTGDLTALAREVTDRQRQLETALAALRESEERARLLVESVKDYAIFMLDPDDRVATWNAGAASIIGYAADEAIGKPRSSFYPADAVQRGQPEHDLARAATDGRHEIEGWRVRKDGSRFWANSILTPLRDAEGGLRGFSAVVRDITERKRAEERITASLREKDVLLKELHHRVKNNLQVISSLLSLQSKSTKDRRGRAWLDVTRNRVRSMALIHEQLYRSPDLATIDFADYLQSLATNLFRSYAVDPERITLTTDLEAVSLGIDTALPCGLILNELISNALKHAFPRGRRGQIHIGLRADGEGRRELTVRDDGVGLAGDTDLRQPPTFGLQLVAMLTEQLGATIELDHDGGTRFTLRFPVEAVPGREGQP